MLDFLEKAIDLETVVAPLPGSKSWAEKTKQFKSAKDTFSVIVIFRRSHRKSRSNSGKPAYVLEYYGLSLSAC